MPLRARHLRLMNPPDIFQICVDEAEKLNLEFLLIGGHAMNARGYERTTLDFDFLIASRSLHDWSKLLEMVGYQLLRPDRIIKAFAP